MIDPGDLETAARITPLLYDAVLDESRWPEVLGIITHTFRAKLSALFVVRPSEGTVVGVHSADRHPDAIRSFLRFDRHADGDPRLKK